MKKWPDDFMHNLWYKLVYIAEHYNLHTVNFDKFYFYKKEDAKDFYDKIEKVKEKYNVILNTEERSVQIEGL